MEPTTNDVLSGRGAWFNQHPGNKHFRKMLEEQKAVYMTGTKKQKMSMSNTIVEAIYSMDPPGRFLKKCPETDQWNELSKRDAADRVAQAMAYAVCKVTSKRKREERRRSRSIGSPHKSQDDAGAYSSQYADRTQHKLHTANNQFGGGAVSTNNVQSSAFEQLPPGNSSTQQQLLQQLLQFSTTTLPTSSGNPTDQNGLTQLLVQALYQQQQLPLQYLLGQDSLGLQTQPPLQPASLGGLTQLLNQTQQQQNDQQQLLLRHTLTQQTVLPFASLPPANNLLQNQVQPQTNPSNALLLSVMNNNLQSHPNSNVGISNTPQVAQQMDQLQRSLMLQQQQLLASSLGAASNNLVQFQQQQSQPFDPLPQQAWQAAVSLLQNSQGLQPPPINFAALASANATAKSTRNEEQTGP